MCTKELPNYFLKSVSLYREYAVRSGPPNWIYVLVRFQDEQIVTRCQYLPQCATIYFNFDQKDYQLFPNKLGAICCIEVWDYDGETLLDSIQISDHDIDSKNQYQTYLKGNNFKLSLLLGDHNSENRLEARKNIDSSLLTCDTRNSLKILHIPQPKKTMRNTKQPMRSYKNDEFVSQDYLKRRFCSGSNTKETTERFIKLVSIKPQRKLRL